MIRGIHERAPDASYFFNIARNLTMADYDELLERLHEGVLRLSDTRQRRVTPAIDDTPERTRQAIRILARSRVSAILRQLRAAHGFTYEHIQQRTGLSQQLLFDVEFKDRRLTLDELRRLADCYGAGVADILGVDVD